MAYPTDDDSNRVRGILDDLVGIEDPDDMMTKIMETLSETPTRSVEEGKFYTFVYVPKTPNIQYDLNPLVAVGNVFPWGFRGMNFHWGEYRQYTWSEVFGGVYEVYPEEFQDLIAVPYRNIRLNN